MGRPVLWPGFPHHTLRLLRWRRGADDIGIGIIPTAPASHATRDPAVRPTPRLDRCTTVGELRFTKTEVPGRFEAAVPRRRRRSEEANGARRSSFRLGTRQIVAG